eukprot:14593435-Alexandrium_andersonii.AAC.1
MPPIPWSVDPDHHHMQLTSAIVELLVKHFPKQSSVQCRASWISPETWQIMARRRGLKSAVTAMRRKLPRALHVDVLQAWRSCCPRDSYKPER